MSQVIVFPGLQPQPLSGYLGGLGLFRIASTIAERRIHGRWAPTGFELSGIDLPSLRAFLQTEWRPSPVFTPWNNASGFYPSSKGNQARAAMNVIVASSDERFVLLRGVIARLRAIISAPEAPGDQEKADFIARLRNELPDEALHWIDAVSVSVDGDARMMPLLGSGGNEGVLDYSGLYLRSLQDTLLGVAERSARLLDSALLGTPCDDLLERAGGQFDPGTAGGFNTGPGFESKDLPNNPWSFLLLIEGSLAWSSGYASRQLGEQSHFRLATSPFTVRHSSAGYSSASRVEDDSQRVRAEVWMPVWNRPASFAEVLRFIAEGRVDVKSAKGLRRAEDSFDFVDAVASLGVDRGVESFVRYAFVKRRGDSYLALPAGVVPVGQRKEADLTRELDAPLGELDAFLRRFPGDGPPPSLASLRRTIGEARFDALARGGPGAMLMVLRALGAMVRALSRRDPAKEPKLRRPLTGLSGAWVDACEDLPEVRLAAAIASIARAGGLGSIRTALLHVEPGKEWAFASGTRALAWSGQDLPARMANTLRRRLLDASRLGVNGSPFWATRTASVDDVAAFLEPGVLDPALIEDLVYAFTLVKFEQGTKHPRPPAGPVPRAYSLLRLALNPAVLSGADDRARRRPDPAILNLLIAGRISEAIALATARLRVLGFKPRTVADATVDDAAAGRRLAASLLIPVLHADFLAEQALQPFLNGEAHA